MQGLYVKKPKEVELRNFDNAPFPKDDEVKIKMAYGGICGSDISVFMGKFSHAKYPLSPGHELVGTVIEAGENAKYEAGTRVVVFPNTFCGECEHCAEGNTNICTNKKSIGVNEEGGFIEEFTISSKFVLPIPNDLPFERAVLIEPLAVVVHALKKVNITKGTSVAVVGSGNEGMLAAALAYYFGANVTAIDINPKKHELAKQFGNIRAVHPEEVENETFDVVIEAAGTKKSIENGIQLVKPGGSIVLLGLTQEATLPVMHVVRNEISILGSIIYKFPTDFLETIEFLRNKDFKVDPIISKILPLAEYKQAYEAAISGDYGKIIFKF